MASILNQRAMIIVSTGRLATGSKYTSTIGRSYSTVRRPTSAVVRYSLAINKHSPAVSRYFSGSCRPESETTKKHYGTSSSLKQKPALATETEESSELAPKPLSEMPGPRNYPIVGTLLSTMFNKDFDLKKMHKFWGKQLDLYGPIVRLDTYFTPTIVFSTNPEDAEKINRNTLENPTRMAFFSLAKIRKEAADNYFEQKGGILTENEEEWKRVRSRVQTPMMKPKNVSSYLSRMDEVALDFNIRIAELQKEHGEMPSNFQTELYKWALESVGLVALNRRMGCLDPNLQSDSEPMTLINEANNIFDALNECEMGFPSWRFYKSKPYKKLMKSHGEFLRVADQNIRETEAQLLVKKEKQSGEEELTLMETLLLTPGLTRTDVVTLILDMLFAGIDTTAHTIGFTLYLLAKNPESQAKLQEELDSVIGDLQGPLTDKHLAQLSYTKAVVKESLRLFPLLMGFMRTLQSDLVLSGYLVPKGTWAGALNMFIGQNEKYFPKANEFIPDRWLRDRPLGPIHPYASLPFSVGTRMCIGRRIAEQELYTFLARVMHRYSVDYKYKDMDIYTRMVFVPSEPLRFSFTERR